MAESSFFDLFAVLFHLVRCGYARLARTNLLSALETFLREECGYLEGYPDRTYCGNCALTCYEFVVGLNACLDVVVQLGRGNEFGLCGGVSPSRLRDPLLVEAYCQIAVSKFFIFTPAVIYTDNKSDVGETSATYGVLRATFNL